MDRVGNQKEVWVRCPACEQVYNVEKLFWEQPQFASVLLHCPFCATDFAKETAPKVWGLAAT
jgi:hypothetical protein